jgi:hypothetical protein
MTTIECAERSIEDERKEKRRQYQREWVANNRDKYRAYARDYASKNKEKRRGYKLKARYGLDQDQWDAMFASQGGRCAICLSDTPKSKGGWDTDHCHATGIVRGILCHPCNVMIGQSEDNTSTLSNAISYLNRFKQ